MIKRLFSLAYIFFSLLLTFIILSNVWIVLKTKDQLYTNIEDIPENEIGLVLGTSKKRKGGESNPFFSYRLKAASELYHSGKIKKILVSGDNRTLYYNEPVDMQKGLMALNVCKEDIILDYAGLRTLDSIVRCKKTFGYNKVTVITQGFHNYRALFISDFYQMDAIGFSAENAVWHEAFKTQMREYIARARAIVDLYVLNTKPKF